MRAVPRSVDPARPVELGGTGGLAHSEMALMRRVLIFLLTAGATFALAVALLYPSTLRDPEHNLVIAAACAAGAVAVRIWGRRLPRWFVHVLLVVGTASVSVAVVNNTGSNNDDELYYLWVVLFAAYFLGLRATLAHLALIATAYGAALLLDGTAVADDRLRLVVTVTSLTGAGLLVNRLAARQRRMIRRLNDAVRSDPLTGLLNRHGFQEALAAQLAAAQRAGGHFALMVADLDHFKAVNDRLGHAAGDEVLRRVSRLLSSSMRGGDRPGRLGGEEFALLAPDATLEQGLAAAERLRAEVEHRLAGEPRPVTISIGVAVHPEDGSTFDELMLVADRALYAAKEAGRNCVACSGGVADPDGDRRGGAEPGRGTGRAGDATP